MKGDRRRVGGPPVFVAKDETGTPVWRWTCRVPNCGGHDWAGRHADALADALGHLDTHARFGFHRVTGPRATP